MRPLNESWIERPWLEIGGDAEMPVLGALPYVLLVVASVLDVSVRGGLTSAALVDLALAATTAAWMLWFGTLHPEWYQRRGRMTVFFTGLVALGAALVIRAPVFGFYTFTGYLWVFRALHGRWRLLGLAAIAALSSLSQDGGVQGTSASDLLQFAVIFAINLGVALVIAWAASESQLHKQRREQLITELTAANGKLEASLRENAELHSQLLVQAREAGVLEERQRMAREIHDTLAQGLTGIITQLQAADHVGLEAVERRRHLDAAAGLARESLIEARRSVAAMRPEPLEAARLPEALGDVAERWSGLHGVRALVTSTCSPRPPTARRRSHGRGRSLPM